MQHFTHLSDLGPDGFAAALDLAARWKAVSPGPVFAGKVLGMVFFNPSLRTRVSFETAMLRTGGHAVVLNVGAGMWNLEHRDGVRMDGDAAEHVREAVPVLARYVDALAVRTFAGGKNDDEDEADPTLGAFRRFSTVPVASMESAREHPCQGMADMLTLRERFGSTRGLPVTLTWAPHVKPLPKAVPHSFLLSAAAAGCEVRLAHPPGFELHPRVMEQARAYAAATGGSVETTHDQAQAFRGTRAVYAKAWGNPGLAALPASSARNALAEYESWMTTQAKLEASGGDPVFMHCLPVRRNVVVEDAVLDGPRSIVVDQAENRYHAQRAVLARMFGVAT